MNLHLDASLGTAYRSKAQQSRVVTEGWGSANLYCPSCSSNILERAPNNTPVYDFRCNECKSDFQLKALSRPFGRKIADAAYDSMIAAILENRCPHLFVLHYGINSHVVENLLLIPGFSFPASAIEKRAPLSPTARRAGWAGCNIVLSNIPTELVISIVRNSIEISPIDVRSHFERISELRRIGGMQRTWLIDVLNCVRKIQDSDFSLQDVYRYEQFLSALHPKNMNVRAKVRQQLQILRDLGFITFRGNGKYSQSSHTSGR